MQPFVYVFCLLSAFVLCSAGPQGRLAGGDDAAPGQIPYQAALFIGGSPNCGAVIISEVYVLTALQCICSQGSNKPWPPQLFTVAAGSTDLYTGGVRIVVEEITINPNYSELRTGIALLKLTKAFEFSSLIQPIKLSSVNPPDGASVDVSGFGRLKEADENMYRTLQVNEAEVVGAEQCKQFLGKTDNQVLCLAHTRKNGICRGDFGGPAVHDGNLVGVAAYIVGECGSILPDVFTSIAANYAWINAQINQ